MSKFTEILAAAAIPIVSAVLKDEISQGLEKFKSNNTPEVVEEDIKAVSAGLKVLSRIVAGTKTTIDDSAVNILVSSINEFAAANNIVLD